MGTGGQSRGEKIQAVLTCEGDIDDPNFPQKCQKLFNNLAEVLQNKDLDVTKCEPWNSVKVTFNIPKDAAEKLAKLAETGDQALRELGILSIQVEGGQVISMTMAQNDSDSDNETNHSSSLTLPKNRLSGSEERSLVTVKKEPDLLGAAASSSSHLSSPPPSYGAKPGPSRPGTSTGFPFPGLISTQASAASRENSAVLSAARSSVAAAALLMSKSYSSTAGGGSSSPGGLLAASADQSVLSNLGGGGSKEALLANLMSSKGVINSIRNDPSLLNFFNSSGKASSGSTGEDVDGDEPVTKKPRKTPEAFKSKFSESQSNSGPSMGNNSLDKAGAKSSYPLNKLSPTKSSGSGYSIHSVVGGGGSSRSAAAPSHGLLGTSAARLASLPGVSLTAVSSTSGGGSSTSDLVARLTAAAAGTSSVTLSPVPRTMSTASLPTSTVISDSNSSSRSKSSRLSGSENCDLKSDPPGDKKHVQSSNNVSKVSSKSNCKLDTLIMSQYGTKHRDSSSSTKGPVLINPVTGQFEAGGATGSLAAQDSTEPREGGTSAASSELSDDKQRHKYEILSTALTTTATNVNAASITTSSSSFGGTEPLKLKLKVPLSATSAKSVKDSSSPGSASSSGGSDGGSVPATSLMSGSAKQPNFTKMTSGSLGGSSAGHEALGHASASSQAASSAGSSEPKVPKLKIKLKDKIIKLEGGSGPNNGEQREEPMGAGNSDSISKVSPSSSSLTTTVSNSATTSSSSNCSISGQGGAESAGPVHLDLKTKVKIRPIVGSGSGGGAGSTTSAVLVAGGEKPGGPAASSFPAKDGLLPQAVGGKSSSLNAVSGNNSLTAASGHNFERQSQKTPAANNTNLSVNHVTIDAGKAPASSTSRKAGSKEHHHHHRANHHHNKASDKDKASSGKDRLTIWTESLAKHGQRSTTSSGAADMDPSGSAAKESKSWPEVLESRLFNTTSSPLPNLASSAAANSSQFPKLDQTQPKGDDCEKPGGAGSSLSTEERTNHLNWAWPGRDPPKPGPGLANPTRGSTHPLSPPRGASLRHRRKSGLGTGKPPQRPGSSPAEYEGDGEEEDDTPSQAARAATEAAAKSRLGMVVMNAKSVEMDTSDDGLVGSRGGVPRNNPGPGSGPNHTNVMDILEGRRPLGDPSSPVVPTSGDAGSHQGGEDSGIESMDTLSEKSPNQGESPFHVNVNDPCPMMDGNRLPTYSSSVVGPGMTAGKMSPPVSDSGSTDSLMAAATPPDKSPPLGVGPPLVMNSTNSGSNGGGGATNPSSTGGSSDALRSAADNDAAKYLPAPSQAGKHAPQPNQSAGCSNPSRSSNCDDAGSGGPDRGREAGEVPGSFPLVTSTANTPLSLPNQSSNSLSTTQGRSPLLSSSPSSNLSSLSSSTSSACPPNSGVSSVLSGAGSLKNCDSLPSGRNSSHALAKKDVPGQDLNSRISVSNAPTLSDPASSSTNSVDATQNISNNGGLVRLHSNGGPAGLTGKGTVVLNGSADHPNGSSIGEGFLGGSGGLSNGRAGNLDSKQLNNSFFRSKTDSTLMKAHVESVAAVPLGSRNTVLRSVIKQNGSTTIASPAVSILEHNGRSDSPPPPSTSPSVIVAAAKAAIRASSRVVAAPSLIQVGGGGMQDGAAIMGGEVRFLTESSGGDGAEIVETNGMSSAMILSSLPSNCPPSPPPCLVSVSEVLNEGGLQVRSQQSTTATIISKSPLKLSSSSGIGGITASGGAMPTIVSASGLRTGLPIRPGAKMVPVKLVTVPGTGNVRMLRVSPVKSSEISVTAALGSSINSSVSVVGGTQPRTVVLKSNSLLKAVTTTGSNSGMVAVATTSPVVNTLPSSPTGKSLSVAGASNGIGCNSPLASIPVSANSSRICDISPITEKKATGRSQPSQEVLQAALSQTPDVKPQTSTSEDNSVRLAISAVSLPGRKRTPSSVNRDSISPATGFSPSDEAEHCPIKDDINNAQTLGTDVCTAVEAARLNHHELDMIEANGDAIIEDDGVMPVNPGNIVEDEFVKDGGLLPSTTAPIGPVSRRKIRLNKKTSNAMTVVGGSVGSLSTGSFSAEAPVTAPDIIDGGGGSLLRPLIGKEAVSQQPSVVGGVSTSTTVTPQSVTTNAKRPRRDTGCGSAALDAAAVGAVECSSDSPALKRMKEEGKLTRKGAATNLAKKDQLTAADSRKSEEKLRNDQKSEIGVTRKKGANSLDVRSKQDPAAPSTISSSSRQQKPAALLSSGAAVASPQVRPDTVGKKTNRPGSQPPKEVANATAKSGAAQIGTSDLNLQQHQQQLGPVGGGAQNNGNASTAASGPDQLTRRVSTRSKKPGTKEATG